MSLNERQARAAAAPAGVAITAGAGTGKTHTLGHRYLAHLEEGASPLQIVAVTFTERAAHELRARVRAYARRRFGAHDPRLAELEAATIGTVHALCLRICRDHPEAAGLPPGVRILDPLEGAAWRAERLERAVARAPRPLFEAMPYERVREVFAALLDDPWRSERALARGSEHWPSLIGRMREEARAAHLASPEVRAAAATLRDLRGPEGDKGEELRRAVVAALEGAAAGDPEEVLAPLHGRSARAGAQRAWGDDLGRLREALTVALAALRAWRDDPRAGLALGAADARLEDMLPHLREGYARIRTMLRDAKRRRRVVDFADVEEGAARALGVAEVVDHYRERWGALLVDEVQDTSPIQAEILLALSEFCRTTVVGDAKQSIYGFRGADATVFRRMTERIAGQGGDTVSLDVSYRAHQPLLTRTNHAFEAVLASAHQPLTAHRLDAPHAGPHLRWLGLQDAKGVPAGVRRLAEAHRIADEIHRLVAAGTPVHDDRAEGGVRPLRAGDVAVLARSWAPLDLLAEVLPARGIAAVHTGGGNLLDTREAEDGSAALRFLADPEDDVALSALLRGPCFAVSDVALSKVAEEYRPGTMDPERATPWWSVLLEQRPEGLKRAVTVLEGLRDAAAHEPPSRLLRALDHETGWSAVVANLPGGPRRRADLNGFFALVRQLEWGNADVFTVARRLRRLRAAGAAADRPTLEAEDAVTLTTIHRSKGLEWPVVIIAALDGKPGGSPPAVRTHPELGVAFRVEEADERRAEPALWTCLDMMAKEEEQGEDRRLLYVALTRAGDQAIVSAAGDTGAYLELLRPGLERAEVPREPYPFDPERAGWPAPPLPGDGPDGQDGQDGPGGAAERLASVASVASAGPAAAEAPTGKPARGERASDAWDLARLIIDGLVPELNEVIEALAGAGLPAPDTDGFARPCPAGTGEEEGAWTLLTWTLPGGVVVLLEPGSPRPAEGGTGAAVTVDPAVHVVVADPTALDATAVTVGEALVACRG